MRFLIRTLVAVAALASLSARQAPADRYWPQWRGPDMTGVSRTATPPTDWSETKNVRWKVEIPGRGSASPVVWGDRIYLLTAVPVGVAGDAAHAPRGALPRVLHKHTLLAIDRKTGKTVWERVAKEDTPHEAAHGENGTWASASAATDGEHIIASFESRGYYAYDMNGTLVWQKDLGDKGMRSQFGEGSTPVLFGNRLVIVWDHITKPSFVVALDKRTGQELWRKERTEIDTWATPLVQVQRLDAVPNVFSSPVGAAGRVYVTGREGSTVVLRHGPKLEVLATNHLDDGFDASPALVDGEIYMRGYKYLYCISEK